MKSHRGEEDRQTNIAVIHSNDDTKQDSLESDERQRLRQEKNERAVQERAQKVRLERERLEADIGRSRNDVNREEGERVFKCVDGFCQSESHSAGPNEFNVSQDNVGRRD